MVTSCQILFQREVEGIDLETGETELETVEVLTYKHQDADPHNLVPLLRRYFQWTPSHDLEEFSANWIYFLKQRKVKEHGLQVMLNQISDARLCGSDHIHINIDHFYIVRIDEEIIKHYEVHGEADRASYFNSEEPDNIYQLRVEEAGEDSPAGSSVQPAQEGGDS
jgi:hypothetical protein